MTCVLCGEETKVLETRDSLYGDTPALRRRRECLECGYRATTYEIDASVYAAVMRAARIVGRLEGPLAALTAALADHKAALADLDDVREVA